MMKNLIKTEQSNKGDDNNGNAYIYENAYQAIVHKALCDSNKMTKSAKEKTAENKKNSIASHAHSTQTQTFLLSYSFAQAISLYI